jgi:gliding motility-associated-like protein
MGCLFILSVFSGNARGQGIPSGPAKKATRYTVRLETVNHGKALILTNAGKTVIGKPTVRPAALLPSIINFPALNNPQLDANNDFDPNATSTNNQTPITYTSSNPAVATIAANGLIHVLGPGITNITASQSGNANYAAADPVTEELIVYEGQDITFAAITAKSDCGPDFSVTASSDNPDIPLSYGSSNTTVATVSAQGVIQIKGPGTTIITVSQAGQGLYILPAAPQQQVLTVNAPLIPVVSVAPNVQSICTGGSVTFTATISGAGPNPTYQWQLIGLNAGANSPVFTTVIASSTDIVQCTVTADDYCMESTTSNQVQGIIVQLYITPSIIINSTLSVGICSGTTITFTAIPSNAGQNPTYQWQVNGNEEGTNSPVFTGNNFATGDAVTCVLTNNAGGCLTATTAISNSIPVSFIAPQSPAPAVTVTASANNVMIGTLITFTATPQNTGIVNSYQWQINGKNTGPDGAIFTTASLSNGDTVTCTLALDTGCTVSVTSLPVIVTIVPPPIGNIPNAFTPNGDGINDIWNIPNLVYYPKCTVNIYTRWGRMIFQSRGYSNPWDGNYSGKQLPGGAYYYLISLDNKSKPLSGYVLLLR